MKVSGAGQLSALPPVQLEGARSYACGFVSPFREPVVLTGRLVEVVFERGRRRNSSQLAQARRALAVVIRRQGRRRWGPLHLR